MDLEPGEPADGLYRVVTPSAVFGLEVRDGSVIRAAPYARGQGSQAESVIQRWRKRGADVERIAD